jgi:MFS superfamily sulfate permease-like transporter
MENWLIILFGGIGLFIIGFFIESVRDFYEEVWEYISEGLEYVFSFDWFSDFIDFLSSAFEDLSEFSMYGLTFGVLGTGLIFFTRDYMITPFVQYYDPVPRMFWTIATYLVVFLGGYFLGKSFEKSI